MASRHGADSPASSTRWARTRPPDAVDTSNVPDGADRARSVAAAGQLPKRLCRFARLRRRRQRSADVKGGFRPLRNEQRALGFDEGHHAVILEPGLQVHGGITVPMADQDLLPQPPLAFAAERSELRGGRQLQSAIHIAKQQMQSGPNLLIAMLNPFPCRQALQQLEGSENPLGLAMLKP